MRPARRRVCASRRRARGPGSHAAPLRRRVGDGGGDGGWSVGQNGGPAGCRRLRSYGPGPVLNASPRPLQPVEARGPRASPSGGVRPWQSGTAKYAKNNDSWEIHCLVGWSVFLVLYPGQHYVCVCVRACFHIVLHVSGISGIQFTSLKHMLASLSLFVSCLLVLARLRRDQLLP